MNQLVRRTAVIAGLAVLAATPLALASSHREAPMISKDPTADNTDVYAFVSPADPSKVTLISNFIPAQDPQGGPNFYPFDDNVLYEIHVDNDGDAIEDITFQFRFRTDNRNPNTFLYNAGQVTSLDDADLIVVQRYSVNRTTDGRRSGRGSDIGANLLTAPSNVGVISMPDYPGLAASAVHSLSGGIRVFAGQREEGFYVDLHRIFDLLQITTGTPRDGLAGKNVNSIAIEIPIEQLTSNGQRPAGPTAAGAIIGVWSTASRPQVSVLRPGGQAPDARGNFVQVSRLGSPLVNEVVIPRGMKDAFNASEPIDDAQFAAFVTNPELGRLLNALFGLNVPPAPRNDLVQIFLTGIPGATMPPGVRASEMLRLNTGVPPSGSPNRLGVIGGDLAGFPNGRRVGDDVVDIALTAVTGILVPGFGIMLGDGVNGNDRPYLATFPYLGVPNPGNPGR